MGSGDVVGGVGFYDNWFVGVEMHDARCGGEGLCNFVEDLLCFRRPCKGEVFACELCQGVSDRGIPEYKWSVQIGESNERLYIFNLARGIALLHCFYVCGVHTYPAWGDDESYVGSCLCVQLALLQCEEKIVGA